MNIGCGWSVVLSIPWSQTRLVRFALCRKVRAPKKPTCAAYFGGYAPRSPLREAVQTVEKIAEQYLEAEKQKKAHIAILNLWRSGQSECATKNPNRGENK
jgi:hypothetical protein